jgi:hypothetical protein
MEKLGYAKRDIMVSRVKDAQRSQHEAQDEFRSALERFNAVLGKHGGKLEEKYSQLNSQLESAEAKADQVHKKIAAVEDVSDALFHEWKNELKQYKNESLRSRSKEKLEISQSRYNDMIRAMKRAESKLEPALQPLRDNVLFLKHNLNAEAIASLQDDVQEVQTNVDQLIRELEISIAEADKFINEMEGAGAVENGS